MNVLSSNFSHVNHDRGTEKYLNDLSTKYTAYILDLLTNDYNVKNFQYYGNIFQYFNPNNIRSHLNYSNDILNNYLNKEKTYLNIGCGGGFLEKIFKDQNLSENIIGCDWNFADIVYEPIRRFLEVEDMTEWQMRNIFNPCNAGRVFFANKNTGRVTHSNLNKDIDCILLVRFTAFWGIENQVMSVYKFLKSLKPISNELIWFNEKLNHFKFDRDTDNYINSILLEKKTEPFIRHIDLTKI